MTPDPVVARLTRIAEQLARRSVDAPTDVCVHMTKSVAAGVSADLRAVLRGLEEESGRLDFLEASARQPGGILLHDEHSTGRMGLGLMSWSSAPRTLREAIDQALPSRALGEGGAHG